MEGKQFKNKVIIITGASSGIGKACALEFAGKGATVVLAARNLERLNVVENSITNMGGEAFTVIADVRKVDDCENLINKTIKKYGKIDILMNNAGISMRATFEDLDLSVIKELMDTNFYGAVYCTKFALPHIIKQKGTVIGISSIAGLAPLPGRTGYVASKHAMNGFLNTLRLENIKKEMNVMIVHPGFTESRIRKNALNKMGVAQKESPRNEKEMMSAVKVAKSIAKACLKGKRSLVLTRQGKLAVWMYKIFPLVFDLLIYNQMASEFDYSYNSFSKVTNNNKMNSI